MHGTWVLGHPRNRWRGILGAPSWDLGGTLIILCTPVKGSSCARYAKITQ